MSKRRKTITYNKLSTTDRQIIEAVQQSGKSATSTLLNIAATYQKTTNTGLERNALYVKLIQAEETGLVSRQIVNRQDEPIQTWKTNVNLKARVNRELIMFSRSSKSNIIV